MSTSATNKENSNKISGTKRKESNNSKDIQDVTDKNIDIEYDNININSDDNVDYDNADNNYAKDDDKDAAKTADAKKRNPNIMYFGDEVGPHVDLYEAYNWIDLKDNKQRMAAIVIQRKWRQFYASKKRVQMKAKLGNIAGSKMAQWLGLNQSLSPEQVWSAFVTNYNQTILDVQNKFGIKNPKIANLRMEDVEHFIEEQMRFNYLFSDLVGENGTMNYEMMQKFFKLSDVHPTEQELRSAISIAFTECSANAEFVFVLASPKLVEIESEIGESVTEKTGIQRRNTLNVVEAKRKASLRRFSRQSTDDKTSEISDVDVNKFEGRRSSDANLKPSIAYRKGSRSSVADVQATIHRRTSLAPFNTGKRNSNASLIMPAKLLTREELFENEKLLLKDLVKNLNCLTNGTSVRLLAGTKADFLAESISYETKEDIIRDIDELIVPLSESKPDFNNLWKLFKGEQLIINNVDETMKDHSDRSIDTAHELHLKESASRIAENQSTKDGTKSSLQFIDGKDQVRRVFIYVDETGTKKMLHANYKGILNPDLQSMFHVFVAASAANEKFWKSEIGNGKQVFSCKDTLKMAKKIQKYVCQRKCAFCRFNDPNITKKAKANKKSTVKISTNKQKANDKTVTNDEQSDNENIFTDDETRACRFRENKGIKVGQEVGHQVGQIENCRVGREVGHKGNNEQNVNQVKDAIIENKIELEGGRNINRNKIVNTIEIGNEGPNVEINARQRRDRNRGQNIVDDITMNNEINACQKIYQNVDQNADRYAGENVGRWETSCSHVSTFVDSDNEENNSNVTFSDLDESINLGSEKASKIRKKTFKHNSKENLDTASQQEVRLVTSSSKRGIVGKSNSRNCNTELVLDQSANDRSDFRKVSWYNQCDSESDSSGNDPEEDEDLGCFTREEVMQIALVLKPPKGLVLKVDLIRKSTWIRPIINFEVVCPAPERIKDVRTIEMNKPFLNCLKIVFKSRLEREGHLKLPVGSGTDFEVVTELKRALELARLYMCPQG